MFGFLCALIHPLAHPQHPAAQRAILVVDVLLGVVTLACAAYLIANTEALFERGKRLDESKPGSGLGLAIVRDIAELSGGGVALARSEMGGLKVTLTLPMVEQLRG